MALLQLSSLAVAAALISVGLALPPAMPSARGDPLQTHDAGKRAGAEIQTLARDGEMLMIYALKPNMNSAESLESKQDLMDTRDEKPKGGAELNGRYESHEQKKPLDMAKTGDQEVRRFADTEEVKSRKPVSGFSAKKPIFTGSSRLLKNPLRRGGADWQPRTKPEPRSETQQLRTAAETLTPRMEYFLPIGKLPLKSDNYPDDYALNKISSWTLRPKGSGTASITITCPNFLLEASENCMYDYLSINGRKYCGSDAPPSITANWLKIEFGSDASVTARGFSCEIEVHDGCCGRSGRGGRIVGGADVSPSHSLPWQVGLMLTNPQYKGFIFCGGSVLNSRFVITAAHCTDGQSAASISVAVGLHNRKLYNDTAGSRIINVKTIHQHASYSSQTMDQDISLLELDGELVFSDSVRPVCLPRGGDAFSDVDALVSGWGTLQSGGSSPDVLRSVTVHTMTNDQCNEAYGGKINKNMLCAAAAGKDSCQGDSGGPLVTQKGGRFTQIGVVSFGAGCADARYPGVYVRMTELLNWIDLKSLDGQVCQWPVTDPERT